MTNNNAIAVSKASSNNYFYSKVSIDIAVNKFPNFVALLNPTLLKYKLLVLNND